VVRDRGRRHGSSQLSSKDWRKHSPRHSDNGAVDDGGGAGGAAPALADGALGERSRARPSP